MSATEYTTVEALRPGVSGINLKLKVVESKLVVDRKRGDGQGLRVAECLVGDQSGCVVMSAKNDQVDQLQPGVSFYLHDGLTEVVRGVMRITGEKSKVEVAGDESDFDFKPKTDWNVSAIEFEQVIVPSTAPSS